MLADGPPPTPWMSGMSGDLSLSSHRVYKQCASLESSKGEGGARAHTTVYVYNTLG